MSHRESVYVTGIGTILPGADGVEDFWRHLNDGASQFSFLTRCDVGDLPVSVAGEVRDFDHRTHLPDLAASHAAKYSRDILMVMSAVEQARRDAGLTQDAVEPRRISMVASCSRGPLTWVDTAIKSKFDRSGLTDTFGDKGAMLRGLPGGAATLSAIHSGVQGSVTTLSNACVGGNHAIGLAMDALRSDRADAVLVVGYEFPLVPVVFQSFSSMGKGVLAAEPENPARAMKPYTRQRDGLVLAEGVVVMVLERASFARGRRARVYAEVLGHEGVNEASSAFSMDLTGDVTACVVRNLLADAGADPRDVQYYCGHGTGTKYNDIAESRALGSLYSDRPRSKWPPLSSIKPIYGHLLGGAGVLNAAATSLMIHHGTLAPTINYSDPEPDCDHDHVEEGARPVQLELAVSLTFALGSQTSAIALGAAA
jgi:3-oxoacyl-[acyl-carrier-protein] synthase II